MGTCSSDDMNKFIFFLLLIGTISCVHAACFDNGTFPNSTANPCLVNGGPFYQLPPAAYPPHLSSPYYQQVNPYQQPYGYQTGARVPTPQLPGSNVIFPKTGYQNAYNPYYRPDDISRLGYSYPAGYRGPQTEYYQYGGPQYNNHLSQPPSRYTLGQGHPNFSPVAPLFQRRTYNSMYDPDHRQDHTREPIFMDRGTVAFMGRDAELTCAFYDNRYRIVSNVAWVKVTGPYEAGALHPPFECHRPGCNYLYLNSYDNFRFRVITLGQTSTLRIYDQSPADQGIYRCAATAQGPDGHTVTVYKIIEFFTPLVRPPYTGR